MEANFSRHVTSLIDQPPAFANEDGSILRLESDRLPIARGLSIRRLTLSARSVREPHWHANAHELGYCVRGQALVTVVGNHGKRDTFTVAAGEMFFFPSGTLHAIENTGAVEAEFILAFSHDKPEDFSLSRSFGAMSDPVLSNTFESRVRRRLDFGKLTPNSDIFELLSQSSVEKQARHPNAAKYAIEAASPHVVSDAGSARTAQQSTWSALDGLAMFSVRINDSGMREPHWHPETAEMGYVLAGEGRMTVLDPGSMDTYFIKPGDVYFIPPAYPHHIENVGEGTLHILIFFNRSALQDVGYRAAAAGYSRQVIAAGLNIAEQDLPVLPIDLDDPLIVAKL